MMLRLAQQIFRRDLSLSFFLDYFKSSGLKQGREKFRRNRVNSFENVTEKFIGRFIVLLSLFFFFVSFFFVKRMWTGVDNYHVPSILSFP